MEVMTYTSKTPDHLGLIAGIMLEIDLAGLIVQKGKPTTSTQPDKYSICA